MNSIGGAIGWTEAQPDYKAGTCSCPRDGWSLTCLFMEHRRLATPHPHLHVSLLCECGESPNWMLQLNRDVAHIGCRFCIGTLRCRAQEDPDIEDWRVRYPRGGFGHGHGTIPSHPKSRKSRH